MIHIFNRKELYITYSTQSQARIRNVLAENGIDYHVKVVNRKSPSPLGAGSRARTGTFGEKLELENEYIFYVKKEDYEKASSLVL